MPAAGAHYQFGQMVLRQCPPHVAQRIQQEKGMFDLGTQGPDILFFYRPYSKNPIAQLGGSIHRKGGHHLFLPLLPHRDSWSPALTAYLLGVCCHYGLDRLCHSLIDVIAPSHLQHQEIEAALDRLIFDQQGVTLPRQKMIPKAVDIPALQTVYDQLTKGQLREAAHSLRWYTHLLEHPRLLTTLEGISGKRGAFSPMCVPPQVASDAPAHQVLALFPTALEDTLRLMTIILDQETTEDDLLREMKLNYEGVTP